MGTIVVGFVPRPPGHAALRQAAAEAHLRNADLVAVHSHRPHHQVDDQRSDRSIEHLIRQEIEPWAVDAEVHEPVFSVDPSEDLLSMAAQRSAELIVIGIRHRSAVGKLVLGSLAQRVLLEATCPVLAVKA